MIQSIQNFFWRSSGSLEQVAWVLATQRQEKLSINNYLLKPISVTIISNVFIERNCHFIIQTAYSFLAVIEAQETEEDLIIWTDTLAAI